MGKASRKAKHGAKMASRRRAKAAKRAAYAALAGTSKKSKVMRKRAKRRTATGRKHAHLMMDCGNPGCKRCGKNLARRAKLMGAVSAPVFSGD